jgi:hypothetical protein
MPLIRVPLIIRTEQLPSSILPLLCYLASQNGDLKRMLNLANRLSTRFDQQGNDEDLNQAIALHREALALRPIGHTHRPMSLNNLALLFSTRFKQRGNDGDLRAIQVAPQVSI